MQTPAFEAWPQIGESLAHYVRRRRETLGLSQRELALKAAIHPQSVGKIERGQTTRLNLRTKKTLALALEIPAEHLEAAERGRPLPAGGILQFCPHCWEPGSEIDTLWLDPRAHYCYRCGTPLCDRCPNCQESVTSSKFRFCPYCGTGYKAPL
ncbi:MAG: zinc ribbon domain-containing protein [Aphanocapsa lilacina HA4352-LM1]|uniref:Zinc ribbon domain-containing protein n=1 Tax=Gloeobacter morelensis MG652769 TaxID=2781736 RepID=A0ABY3PSK7_9CYAN|nr:zinc ribbon domain-containing protein [Gloeobacter morelensis]MBW4697949.1 zinc ribbon domain-containing protein [Aphanocapsa lilacina HA4352-LM1]UFP96589.1 zinc ribbon domain-containing protein [Gloeobacter morelensis MG652769]